MSEVPFSLEQALAFPATERCRQVVMIDVEWEQWVRGVYAAGLYVFPIPYTPGEELPTYAVGVLLPRVQEQRAQVE